MKEIQFIKYNENNDKLLKIDNPKILILSKEKKNIMIVKIVFIAIIYVINISFNLTKNNFVEFVNSNYEKINSSTV